MTLGELAGAELGSADGFGTVDPAVEEIDRLGVARGLRGGGADAPGGCKGRGSLLDDPAGKHRLDAAVDPLGKRLPGHVHDQQPAFEQRIGGRGKGGGEGPAGEFSNLEGPDNPLRIVRVDSSGGRRINLCKPAVDGSRTIRRDGRHERRPNGWVCRGEFGQAVP